MDKRTFINTVVFRLKLHEVLNISCGECTVDVMDEEADDVEIAIVRAGYRVPASTSAMKEVQGDYILVRTLEVVNFSHN